MANTPELPASHPHTSFALQRLPGWMTALDKPTLDTLGASLLSEQYLPGGKCATWFSQAPVARQQALLASQKARAAARTAVSAALGEFKSVLAFAEPLLNERLTQLCGRAVNVHETLLVQVREQASWLSVAVKRTPLEQSLLLAALHNFNQDQAFDLNSGLVARHGYTVDYVPGPILERLPPSNPGDQNGDFSDLLPEQADFPVFDFKPGARLSITPQAFARECRDLDIGRQYQQYLDRVLLPAPVRGALLAARVAELDCLRQVAVLKGDIDAATFTLFGQVIEDKPLLRAGLAMQGLQLEILQAVLHDVVVFMPANSAAAAQPCIVWMPGDSQAPLRQYASSAAFITDLANRLRDPAYRNEFLGRVDMATRPDFLQRLTAQLARERVTLGALTAPLQAPLLDHLHERHMAWLRSQAACLAIPTARVDYLATLDRWEGYLQSGINVLNFAALFIPGLGQVMLPIIAAQAMGELYHGLADLADHHLESAWEHLGGLALNIVVGVVAHQTVKFYGSVNPFVEDLVPVQLADGTQRLWYPDITPYATELMLEPQWLPDAQGLYAREGAYYVALDGKLYLTEVDTLTGQRVICRPGDPSAYRPPVTSDGRGTWKHQGENPLRWSRRRLLQRATPHAATLTDAELEQALSITGEDEAVLRQAVVEGAPPPLELSDTLERVAAARRVERLVACVREGQAMPEGWPVPMEVMVEHPRWPSSLVLQLFEGSEPWGLSTDYGDVSNPAARWVSLVRADLASGERMGQLLDGLGDSACDELLGSVSHQGRAARMEGLQALLAEQLEGRRPDVLPTLLTTETVPRAPGSEALGRDFPGLDSAQQRELIEGATFDELERLKAGRVPLRMAEEARVLLRERRINRAIAGFFQPALANADSAVLNDAWGKTPPGAAIDRNQVATLLGIQRGRQGGFNSPVRVGSRIGYPASGRGHMITFDAALVAGVGELYPNLETTEIFDMLTALERPEPQLRAWLQGQRSELKRLGKQLDKWVSAGKALYGKNTPQALNRTNVAQEITRAARRSTPRVVTHAGARVGFEMNLNGMRLDGLGPLEADFSHVKSLILQSTGLSGEGPTVFLEQFSELRHLNLTRNELTTIPTSVTRMRGLTRLRLSHNRIVWGEPAAQVLGQLTQLRELDLGFNPLGTPPDMTSLRALRGVRLPGAGLQEYPASVLQLPEMGVLDLRHNRLNTLPADVLAPPAERAEQIGRINRDTHLEGNPLSAPTLDALREQHAVTGNRFGLASFTAQAPVAPGTEGATRWLQRVPTAAHEGLKAKWQTLRAEPGSQAFFQVLDELAESRDFQHAETYTDLRERVWKMIEAASDYTELRETLFEEAAHGGTCGDGASLLFSVLQVRSLVFEASRGVTGEVRQLPLLKLAKGLFRLDEVDKAAFADVRGRTTAPDVAEVQLVYRTRLADTLDLPGQPKGMRFARTADVSEQAVATTQASILAMDGSTAMVESVAARDFWVANLRQVKANEARFNAHDNTYYNLLTALDGDAEGGAFNSARYQHKLDQLTARRQAAERRLVLELTQAVFDQEVQVTEL
ncbi:NEL-type E3 ubiquitin ligase domain-containing protein [Pseudomonas sp. RIT-To-2]|uniref:NEL-type E3 ubiquitin ligase domain-containing protein n=1 Tax=Pseudomonas sp. RIT-To-2 TaxID=3462541 RepID=UPI0024130D88